MPNQLAQETSPYLLQHQHNPVQWHPWGDTALELARQQDRPIFLSIGYSACHWCHVMEHESFEDTAIAAALNEHFICIKVDREERPDLDQIYMTAVQLLTGRGGWPMSVFLTPDREPFFGGTYWPPKSRMGMPGFDDVIRAVIDAWTHRRELAIKQAGQLTQRIASAGVAQGDGYTLASSRLLVPAAASLEEAFDSTYGGFGPAPKFPNAMNLQLLLRVWRRTQRERLVEMVKLNLDKMYQGGIYDHLAGGFARYAVDQRWLVPHFEKMLYDNSLLAQVYLDAFTVTGDPVYARVARETLDYVLRYLQDDLGGFHSSEDADSEGVEGKFYIWTPAEVVDVLGSELAERFCLVYDVTDEGNFEGRNILNLPQSLRQCAEANGWPLDQLEAEMAAACRQLLARRDTRVRPNKDDKVLVNWNGLAIDALAQAAMVFGEARYRDAAVVAAKFILENLRDDAGRLMHSWRAGQAKSSAFLDDYACLANGLVTLYEATFDERWIDCALDLVETARTHFADQSGRGFFYTADDHESLIARTKDLIDSSVPSGNSMMAAVLIRLGKLCGRMDLLEASRSVLDMAAATMERAPMAMGQMLVAMDMAAGPMAEIVVIGEKEHADTAAALDDLFRRYLPNRVIACRHDPDLPDGSANLDPIFLGRLLGSRQPTIYVCENFACGVPVEGPEAVAQAWRRAEDLCRGQW